MPITREQWAEVEGVVSEYFELGAKKKKDFNALLYNTQKSSRSQENHLGIGSIGQMAPWTGTVSYDEFRKGFQKGYRHAKYSKGLQFEEEVFRFEEFGEIEKRSRVLLDAVYKTYQAHGVSTFNNAFDASLKGPDNVALCSASHPYSPSDNTLQSNVDTLALTMPNLKTVFNRMSMFKDDRGDLSFVMPNVLLTGIEYREEALKICGPQAGDKEPFTAENDANIYKGDLTYIYHPLITGKKWFLIDRDRMLNYLYWYNARNPMPVTDRDFNTEIMSFAVIGMFSYGWDHWDWIFGCSA